MKRRNILLIIIIGAVVLVAALVSGFVLMQPTAEDILVQTLETLETIDDAHAVVEIEMATVERDESAKIELWGRRGEDGPGAFRLVVLETSNKKAAEAIVVSDGENLWAYAPAEGKVFVGSAEEAKKIMAEKQPYMDNYDKSDHDHPENPNEAIEMLLDYFEVTLSNTELVADTSARLLILNPIPEQMPAEYAAVGGLINLWIDENRSLPLAVEFTGSSFGNGKITVSKLEINKGIDETLFTFDPPEDAEVISFADLAPQTLSLAEAAASAEFELLTPQETPEGATLVDVIEVKGVIVQRFTLPDGGSFSIAQGTSDEFTKPSNETQSVEVRGVSGSLLVGEDGSKVLLTWSEGDLFYSVAGDLTQDQALTIAESLQ
jgi:outer membrane lipoprotein-sorting protein